VICVPARGKGDKDVKKEFMKTSYLPLDFSIKKITVKISQTKATNDKNLIKIEEIYFYACLKNQFLKNYRPLFKKMGSRIGLMLPQPK
jgi:hypothetical protein